MRPKLRAVVTAFVILNLKLFTLVTKRPRARVLVVNEDDQVLLIRAVISHGRWSLPGGGLNRHETAVAAARRELFEETGIAVDESALVYMTTLKRPDHDIPFEAPLFYVSVRKSELPNKNVNPREIEAIGWFDKNQLPTPLSLIASAAIEMK